MVLFRAGVILIRKQVDPINPSKECKIRREIGREGGEMKIEGGGYGERVNFIADHPG